MSKKPCGDCPINNKDIQDKIIEAALRAAYSDPSKPNSLRAIAASLPKWLKADHKRVGRILGRLKRTGALPQLVKTLGKDGKLRIAERTKDDETPVDGDDHVVGGDPLACEFATPQWLFDVLNQEFHFDLDACATDAAAAKCERFYSPVDDGLSQPWASRTFCNPPYNFNDLTKWVVKGYEEAQRGNVVVMLLPHYKSAPWFRSIVMQYGELRHIQGTMPMQGFGRQAGKVFFSDTFVVIFRPGQSDFRFGGYINKPGKEAPVIKVSQPAVKKRSAKLPERITNVVLSDNAELLANVAEIYFQPGMRIADVTYGQGKFWNKLDMTKYEFLPSDKETGKHYLGVEPHDCRHLPYEDGSLDVVAFDPPLGRHTFHWFESRYKTKTFDLNNGEIVALYQAGMREAKRVLRKGGLLLVKCQDQLEGSGQCRNSHSVWEFATRELGMQDKDKFVLVCPSKRIVGDPRCNKKQQHAYKAESYLWVFRKR